MRRFALAWLTGLLLIGELNAQDVAPQQWLLEQVRIGEASYKDELVQQSLYRLALIDAANPEVIAARIRLLIRQGNITKAQLLLEKLKTIAPQSEGYLQAKMLLAMTTPQARQLLQQARLMATAGHLSQAKAQYDALFAGKPPTLELAVEYWRLVARLPNGELLAIKNLQALDKLYPGNVSLAITLARMLFSQGDQEQAYQVLQQVAHNPAGQQSAAELWLAQIKAQPVSTQSVAMLQRYLSVFNFGEVQHDGQQELTRQQALLADPAYQAKMQGLAQVEQGAGSTAIALLKQALKAAPNDAELLGALGLAYARSGDRQQAISLFLRAQQEDQNNYHSSKWQSLIKSNRYWLAIKAGDNALKEKNFALAWQKYHQAQQIDNSDSAALVGLGDVAVARQDSASAENYYQRALQVDAGSSAALRALIGLYRQQSAQKARAYINSLSVAQKRQFARELNQLQADISQHQAEQFAGALQWPQAVEQYRLAYHYQPEDVWLVYHYAQALRQAGQPIQADALFSQLAKKHPASLQQIYAYALYLAGSERTERALAHLKTVPSESWNADIQELAQRLKMQLVLEHALALRDAGNETAAVAYLQQHAWQSESIDLTLADWALARADYDEALARYRQLRARDGAIIEAWLGEIDVLLAQGKLNLARRCLQDLAQQNERHNDKLTVNSQRRIANAWLALGDIAQANSRFAQLKKTVQLVGDSQQQALVYRDAARLARAQLLPKQAQDDYLQALLASGVIAASPANNEQYTRVLRYVADDDWLKRSIRADAAELYRQQDINLSLDYDYWHSNGTEGISNYQVHNSILQLDMPLLDGRAFLRTDSFALDAGSFATTDGSYSAKFGTCSDGCVQGVQQRAHGTGIVAGWRNEQLAFDIGTTPRGFAVADWIGSLAYSSDWQHIGWTIAAVRQPISSSLLAFAGAKDPRSGITWGGVRATGVDFSASYSHRERHGVWAKLGVQRLTGKNVANNQRERLMAGYYYKLINQENSRLTIGLNTMLWHYQKDLSGYTLGQGGYYSPQQYLSLSLPISFRQRTENWSFELGGSMAFSHAKNKAMRRYPLAHLVANSLSDSNEIENATASYGTGYTLQAVVERRLSTHWAIGAGIDIQQAKDYTPNHALLYLRYSLGGWQGDLDLPPQPLAFY